MRGFDGKKSKMLYLQKDVHEPWGLFMLWDLLPLNDQQMLGGETFSVAAISRLKMGFFI